MPTTYPNGYGTQVLGLDDLRARHAGKMHPEYARRLFACLEAADGLVGIGGSWRSTEMQAQSHARAPNTFAPPGRSFHETHRFASGVEAFVAVDTVGRKGRHDDAWNWMRDNAGVFGLRTFWNVNGEPWHVQFSDLPNGVTAWKKAGCPDPGTFVLPGGTTSTTSTMSSTSTASSGYGPHPANAAKPELRVGCHGSIVRYAQQVIADKGGGRITVDGDFGPKTESRVKDVQFLAELAPTGVVDWGGTWQFLDRLCGVETHVVADPKIAVETVELGYYWIQRGDSPWSVAERVYGDGRRHSTFDPCEPADPGFTGADHHVRLPGVAGCTTKVAPGESVASIVGRLAPGGDQAKSVDRFLALNGGPHRVLAPGDLVFLDVS